MTQEETSFLTRKISAFQALANCTPLQSLEHVFESQNLLCLDKNENLQIPQHFMRELLKIAMNQIDPRVYPQVQTEKLVSALSKYLKVRPETILLGAGSDSLINLIAGIIMGPEDTAIVIGPTFSMYNRYLDVYKQRQRSILLKKDFSLNIESIKEFLVGTDEIVFLCSPNNPSGNQFSEYEIRAILESTDGLLVLDEAYVEFAPTSLVRLTEKYENLFVLRTFSKAFGLAGMRIGYGVTNQRLAETLRRCVLDPYPVSTLSLTIANLVFDYLPVFERNISILNETRDNLSLMLENIDQISVYPSNANFLLVEVKQSSIKVACRLLKLGIKVRVVDWAGLSENFLRVTVPPDYEQKRVVNAFKEVLS